MAWIIILFILFVCSIITAIIGICLILRGKNKGAAVLQSVTGIVLAFVTFFAIQIPAPSIFPLDNDMTKEHPMDITLTAEPQLKIYYSLDGTEPREGSQYSAPITITTSCTVAARANFLGLFWSPIAKSTYRINKQSGTSNIEEEKQETPFVRDYAPGQENVYGNLEYYNNHAMLCRQGDMYYISTELGISKTQDFKSFSQVIGTKDGIVLANLCVKGDWIYFTSGEKINRVRTDGSREENIHTVDNGIVSMNVEGDWVYFISRDDGKLYKIIHNGEGLTKLSDKTVLSFVIVDSTAYCITGNFEKIYESGYRAEPLGLLEISINKPSLFEDKEIHMPRDSDNEAELRPQELQYYKNKLYVVNYLGLYSYDLITGAFQHEYSGHVNSLCIINDGAYFVAQTEDDYGDFYVYTLGTGECTKIAEPFENSSIASWFYPTDIGIIYAAEFSNWYIWDERNKTASFLPI